MLPIIPLVCVASIIAGALGLTWYDSLPRQKQQEADRLAGELAKEWFDKTVDELTEREMRAISDAIQRHLAA